MIPFAHGFFNFICRDEEVKLVFNSPSNNRTWKRRFLLVQGVDWVCGPDKCSEMEFDYTW